MHQCHIKCHNKRHIKSVSVYYHFWQAMSIDPTFLPCRKPERCPCCRGCLLGRPYRLPKPLKIFACGEGCATVPVAYRSLRSSCFFSCFRPAFSSSMSSIIFVFSLAAAQVCISLPPCRSRLCCWYAFRANRNSTHYLRNLRPKSCDFFASLRNPKPVREDLRIICEIYGRNLANRFAIPKPVREALRIICAIYGRHLANRFAIPKPVRRFLWNRKRQKKHSHE